VQRINVGNALSGGLEIRSGATLTTNVTGGSQSNIGPGGAAPGVGYLRIKSGATLSQAGLLLVGLNANGTGTVTVEDGGSHTLAGALTVGSAGTGYYNLAGSLTNSASNVILGNSASGIGILNMTGGSLSTTASNVIVGNAGVGTFNLSGGTVTTGTYLQIGNTATSNGAFKQSDGAVQINRSSTTAHGLFIGFTSGAIGLYEISDGSLNVADTNLGVLNGANAAGGGGVGTFRIIGDAPTINIGKNYDQRNNATLDVIIGAGGISPINLGGDAILDGALSASFTSTPTLGQQFPIINYAGIQSGAFATFDTLVDSPLGPDTVQLSIDYGTGTNSAVVLTVVPEPSSMVLFALCLVGSLFARRRTVH
jgi:T5SS/PEP-CTERM-associated repeat protein